MQKIDLTVRTQKQQEALIDIRSTCAAAEQKADVDLLRRSSVLLC